LALSLQPEWPTIPPPVNSSRAIPCNAYRGQFQIALSGAGIDLIRETTSKNWMLGNQRFRRQIRKVSSAPRLTYVKTPSTRKA
jgi:hypothetical protein